MNQRELFLFLFLLFDSLSPRQERKGSRRRKTADKNRQILGGGGKSYLLLCCFVMSPARPGGCDLDAKPDDASPPEPGTENEKMEALFFNVDNTWQQQTARSQHY